jgi:NADPH:quinone reductase-like Zn-dependent oxidoreductase
MKAARIHQFGDTSNVVIDDITTPEVAQGQVLIKISAASLNPFDSAVRAGHIAALAEQLPFTLGGDIAGTVVAVADDITHIAVGDMVYGDAGVISGNSGAFAEYAVTAATHVASMPTTVDFAHAAALPLVGASALQGITRHIALQSGQKIFIHGGAGGIGAIAIQIAKHIGAYVATTATGDDLAYVRWLGADEVIDYASQQFTELLSNYDAVFDTVGGNDFNDSFDILKRGGIAVSMIGQPDTKKASALGITAQMQHTSTTTESLNTLRTMVDQGVISIRIARTYPLSQAREAFEAREAGSKGKIVLTL